MIYSKNAENVVKEIFDRKQAKARFLLNAKREKVYTEIPEIKELEKEIASEGVKLAINSLKGMDGGLEDKIKTLAEKRDSLLIKHGFSVDYMSDVYECNICKDTGYTDGIMCDCMKKELRKQSISDSNIAPALMKISLNDFDINFYSDQKDKDGNIPRTQMLYILEKCNDFIENFGESGNKNLLFIGNPGLGKTFLSSAIAREILDKGFCVVYYSAKQLLSMITDYDFGRIPEKRENYDLAYNSDLLIIDDLGSEQQTAQSAASLFDVINTRMLNGKSIIINTNLAAKDLQTAYSDRIFSRLTEFEILKFIGMDIRKMKLTK